MKLPLVFKTINYLYMFITCVSYNSHMVWLVILYLFTNIPRIKLKSNRYKHALIGLAWFPGFTKSLHFNWVLYTKKMKVKDDLQMSLMNNSHLCQRRFLISTILQRTPTSSNTYYLFADLIKHTTSFNIPDVNV